MEAKAWKRRNGKAKGGYARAAKLTPEERKEIAKKRQRTMGRAGYQKLHMSEKLKLVT